MVALVPRAVVLSLAFQAIEEEREPLTQPQGPSEWLLGTQNYSLPLWLIRLGTEEWFSKMPT